MSSQLTTLTTVFNSQDYNTWSKAMRAFLMAQGLWGYCSGDLSEPFEPTEPKEPKPLKSSPSDKEKEKYERYFAFYKGEKAAYDCDLPTFPERKAAWVKANDMALGTITLCLSPALQQHLPLGQTAEDLWDWLKNQFATPSIPTCYRDLKEALSIRFNPAKHPGPQIDRMVVAFNRVSQTVTAGSITVNLTINPVLQGLIVMAAIPPKWEHHVSIICANNDLVELDIETVQDAIVTQYENETNRGGHKGAHNAQKLSAVKQKRGNPHFSQQEHPQQPQAGPSNPNQQQSFRQRGSRGNKGCGGKPNKGKKQADHSHVTSVAAFAAPVFTTDVALPPPSSSTITSFGPGGSTMLWTVYQSPSMSRVDRVYPSVNQALSLLECMDVSPTIQCTKMLEEHFHMLDKQIRARAGFYEDAEDSEDENMSQTVPGCEIFRYAPTDLAEISGESIAHDFEYLTIDSDGIVFDPDILDKENRAPTPPYISPQSVDAELGHSDPEAEAEVAHLLAEEIDIAAEWATKNTYPLLNCQSSNDRIEEAWQCNQDYINHAPTPGLPADFDDGLEEALDWGSSDEEKYAFSSFSTLDANSMTVLDPLSSKGSKGSCNYMSDLAEVCKLYNVNFGVLDVLKCEHKISFTNCAECRQKVSSMWLLDSGASAHFTNNKNDFIKYTPSERQPVRAATHTIWVEGQGTVLLRHYVNGTLVTTRVHPVLYIPAIATRLLSMGEFLQSGLRVKGSSQRITLTHKNKPFVQCKPLIIGQTLYWLDALTTTVEARFIEAIYKVDYDLMHRCLGHPSNEVLRRAKEHTKGFPDGISIPTTSKVCPGCAQGKMPTASHPPSDTRATEVFTWIHSDLKSFPEPSYHKYK